MRYCKIFAVLLLLSVLLSGGEAMAIRIKSPAFNDGGMIPDKYTCKGRDISPPLLWEDVPDGAESFAVICEDPDAPGGIWTHWVIYNIRVGITNLYEGVPPYDFVENGALQGVNDFRKVGYNGPCPPPGVTHRYRFRIYALDKQLETEAGLTREELLDIMEGHIINEAELIGEFKK